jgi:hypothetical protein
MNKQNRKGNDWKNHKRRISVATQKQNIRLGNKIMKPTKITHPSTKYSNPNEQKKHMYPALKLLFRFQKQQQPPEPKHNTRTAKESSPKVQT